ncbi:MAG TPA: SurA N-terminal domain-containing protein [Burkholderiales bacterium]|nr:SurA N-terminal domain-containing protein [Burkholderiales bacterium]
MSWFETLREKKAGKLAAKIILALLMIPFALFGVDYYQRGASRDFVAKVGNYKISPQEFDQAVRERQDQLRQSFGRNFDPTVLDNPEVRRAILEDLINRYALVERAADARLAVPDAELASLIQQVEAFQKDGKFAKDRYEAALRSQNMTSVSFEQRLRQQMMLQQVESGLGSAHFVPKAAVDRMIAVGEEQREVDQATFLPDQFLSQVKVDADAVKAYYEANKTEFEVPEQVRLEYLVLSPDVLAKDQQVAPEEIRKYYEEHAKDFGQPEERRASHILITMPKGAPDAERKAAQAKAEDLAKQARQAPAKFGDLAKQSSQDPGSAANGGDLGFFPRGAMVKGFEDAVFSMKQDEIRGPVESEFGFHVIKLTGIKPGKTVSLGEATPKIEEDLKKQKAGKKFAEVAETFSNLVFEQGDSLKPAADQFKLQVQQSQWVRRKGGEPAFPVTDKMLAAVFSDEVLKNKRNTEAVEVAPNTLVSARVLEYKPAAMRSLEQAGAEIEKTLQRKQASELALKAGKEALAKLQQGESAGVTWSAPLLLSRQRATGLADYAVQPVFRAPVSKLPAYVGVENPRGGYLLVRISKVVEAAAPTDAQRQVYGEQLRQMIAQEQLAAYVASVREKEGVQVRAERLEKKQ